ncbi:MAG: hypothetical protein ACLSHC_06970 [Bilophila wadsworthia]
MDQAPHEAREFIRDLRKAMKPGMELWLWTGHGLDDIPLPPLRIRLDQDRGLPRGSALHRRGLRRARRRTPPSSSHSNQQLHRITNHAPIPKHQQQTSLAREVKSLLSDVFRPHAGIVEGLDAVPERCPGLKQPEREIWMYAGKRELVRNLITVLERQERERTRNPHLGLMPRLS